MLAILNGMTADLDALLALAPALTGLALIDALSLGALAIPVWLLAAPGRLQAGRVMLYLAVLAAFYAAVGVVLLLGGAALVQAGVVDLSHPVARVVLFFVGVGLLILSFVMDPGGKRGRRRLGGLGSRLTGWRDRALGLTEDAGSAGGGRITRLAIIAGGLELVTMIPYLGAIGLLTSSDARLPIQAGALIAYCAVMVLPALVLLFLRVLLRGALTPMLNALDQWFINNGTKTAAWVIGIVGVILIVHNISYVTGAGSPTT